MLCITSLGGSWGEERGGRGEGGSDRTFLVQYRVQAYSLRGGGEREREEGERWRGIERGGLDLLLEDELWHELLAVEWLCQGVTQWLVAL